MIVECLMILVVIYIDNILMNNRIYFIVVKLLKRDIKSNLKNSEMKFYIYYIGQFLEIIIRSFVKFDIFVNDIDTILCRLWYETAVEYFCHN